MRQWVLNIIVDKLTESYGVYKRLAQLEEKIKLLEICLDINLKDRPRDAHLYPRYEKIESKK